MTTPSRASSRSAIAKLWSEPVSSNGLKRTRPMCWRLRSARALDECLHRLDLAHPLGSAHGLLGAADEAIVERARHRPAHELAVVAHRAAEPGALDEEADEEQEHEGGEHAEGEARLSDRSALRSAMKSAVS